MSNKAKIFSLTIGLFFMLLSCSGAVLASAGLDPKGALDTAAGEQYNTDNYFSQDYAISGYLGVFIRGLFSLLGVIAFVFLLYGGWLWMTARGNEEQVEKAKKIIREGVIGLALIFASATIAWVATEMLTKATGQWPE